MITVFLRCIRGIYTESKFLGLIIQNIIGMYRSVFVFVSHMHLPLGLTISVFVELIIKAIGHVLV